MSDIKCRCHHAGWMGGSHDDPHCEYYLAEKNRRERAEREAKEAKEEPVGTRIHPQPGEPFCPCCHAGEEVDCTQEHMMWTHAIREDIEKAPEEIDTSPDPIPMLLWCPSCGKRHLDDETFIGVHHTHACQHCGMVWRPALVPTIGVQFLPGFKNE